MDHVRLHKAIIAIKMKLSVNSLTLLINFAILSRHPRWDWESVSPADVADKALVVKFVKICLPSFVLDRFYTKTLVFPVEALPATIQRGLGTSW